MEINLYLLLSLLIALLVISYLLGKLHRVRGQLFLIRDALNDIKAGNLNRRVLAQESDLTKQICSALSKGYILPIGATLLYLIPVVIAPAYLTGIHPLASVMGIYPHISEAAAAMVESLMQGVLFNTSPLVCVGSLLLIGATFAAASVVALKKQSY